MVDGCLARAARPHQDNVRGLAWRDRREGGCANEGGREEGVREGGREGDERIVVGRRKEKRGSEGGDAGGNSILLSELVCFVDEIIHDTDLCSFVALPIAVAWLRRHR